MYTPGLLVFGSVYFLSHISLLLFLLYSDPLFHALMKKARFTYDGKTALTFLNNALAPVVHKLDSAIHRINHYPVDKCYGNQLRYPLDRDSSRG